MGKNNHKSIKIRMGVEKTFLFHIFVFINFRMLNLIAHHLPKNNNAL